MLTTDQRRSSEELLAGLQRRDTRIMRDFHHRLQRLAFRYAATRYGVQHREVLAEAFTDAFLILLRKLQNGDYRRGNLQAFAFGIIKFTFRDAVRRHQRREAPTAPDELPEYTDQPGPVYSHAVDWLEAIDQPQLLHWFRRLPARYQYLFDLRLQGYNLQEMAEQSGMAYGTLRNVFPRLLREAGMVVQ